MSGNTERLYRIETLIRARGHVSFAELLAELEVSRATLKRDLEFLRSRLGAPIEYDRDLNGYRFGRAYAGARHELPGLWFDESELLSLLTAQQLLEGLDEGGVLARHLKPLLDRIHSLLGDSAGGGAGAAQLARRIRIVGSMQRAVPSRFFERVSLALLQRRRLNMRYRARTRGAAGAFEADEREVSPQRLVHYRHAWYLDAWCHRAGALRRFALDAIEEARVGEAVAKELAPDEVARAMDAGYGIFAGARPRWATVRFSPRAAQWASREQWHPAQRGRWLEGEPEGRVWELQLPYVDEAELVRDLLRQGAEAEVVAPPELVGAMRRELAAALAKYPG